MCTQCGLLSRALLTLALVALGAACEERRDRPTPTGSPDAGSDGAIRDDFGVADTNVQDAATSDARTPDVSELDANADAGALDSSETDDAANPSTCAMLGAIAPSISTGDQPIDVVVADFDRNGRLDFATANRQSGNVTVGLASVDGSYSTASYATVSYPSALRAGDLDGNGSPDLAVVGIGETASVEVLTNDGRGQFGPGRELTRTNYEDVELFDADEDGDLDVVVISPYSATLLFRNRGNASFDASAIIELGGRPSTIRAADLNGDRHLDIVVTDQQVGSDGVRVALGRGDGTFGAATFTAVPIAAWNATLGDVEGDGDLDVFASHSAGHIYLLKNRGDGSLEVAVRIHEGTHAGEMLTADVDRDGRMDLVAVEGLASLDEGESILVLLGRGDGTFRPAREFPVSRAPVAIGQGDFDGDGLLDLAIAHQASDTVSIVEGDGSGGFRTGEQYVVPNKPNDVAAADLNGDGRFDIVTMDDLASTSSVLLSTTDSERFEAPVTYRGGFAPDSLLLGDFSGDHVIDLVLGTHQTENVLILNGDGDGVFGPARPFTLGFSVYALGSGDLDDDGRLDLVMVDSSDAPLRIGFGDGAGGIAAVSTADVRANGYPRVAVAPFDRTPGDDVATATGPYLHVGSVAIVSSTSQRGLSDRQTVVTSDGDIRALGATDLDDDGDVDVVVALYEGSPQRGMLVLLKNDGNGALVEGGRREVGTLPVTIASADMDGDGDQDLLTLGQGRLEVMRAGPGAGLADPLLYTVPGDRLAMGDFDADGTRDLVVTRPGSGPIGVVRGRCP
ncbi:MAG: VCBS repeat-containing protein [Deltaproteobacteria bacterium]|nr:VCBS repeat-containing protein [Deltaproteobacteria bacterium]